MKAESDFKFSSRRGFPATPAGPFASARSGVFLHVASQSVFTVFEECLGGSRVGQRCLIVLVAGLQAILPLAMQQSGTVGLPILRRVNFVCLLSQYPARRSWQLFGLDEASLPAALCLGQPLLALR